MHGVVGGHDLVGVGQGPLLHDRGEGDGDVGEGHPLRARLEHADVVLDDAGDDFAADAEALVVLVDHDQPAGFAYRSDDVLAVQRHQAAQVDDLGADSLDIVELVMALEESFGVSIPDEEAEKITTVQQAIDYVNAHLG